MNKELLGRSAARRLSVILICCALSSLSCVFLYVGGPEHEDVVPPPPTREYVESAIVGAWRFVPLDYQTDWSGYNFTFQPNGTLYHWSETSADSSVGITTYTLTLGRSNCNPPAMVYQLRIEDNPQFMFEVQSLTEDTLELSDCRETNIEPLRLTFVRVPTDEIDYDSPTEE